MPTLSSLEAKRTSLRAQQEQHVALVNRIGGAIALLDDLILEAEAEAEAREAEAPLPFWKMVDAAALDTSHDAPPPQPYIPTGNMTPPRPPSLYQAGDSDAA